MLVCGDDAEAKTVALGLARDLGLNRWMPGRVVVARYLEPLAMLWVHLAFFRGMGPDISLTLVRR